MIPWQDMGNKNPVHIIIEEMLKLNKKLYHSQGPSLSVRKPHFLFWLIIAASVSAVNYRYALKGEVWSYLFAS